MATGDEATQLRVLQGVSSLIADLPPDTMPIEVGMETHRIVRDLSGCADPYASVKRRSNDHALSLLPELRRRVAEAPDPFLAAVKLAAVGNVIDFGADPDFDLDRALEEGWAADLTGSDLSAFRRGVGEARDILYIGDNAGEIVFDRLLVEHLAAAGARVAFAVRGGPILNDATLEDATYVGMDQVAEVVSSGVRSPGTLLGHADSAFLDRFRRADLVLAKGQGNFEGLSDVAGPLFFLLKVKCPVIARHLGAELGSLVLRAATAPPSP
jgi:hypothetical protein